jgi:outer membrane protein
MRALLKSTLLILAAFAGTAHAADTIQESKVLGFGIAAAPEFKGGERYKAFPLLIADYQDASGFFLSTYRGIGYLTSVEGIKLSAALHYAPGRNSGDLPGYYRSKALNGMGEIEGSAVAKLSASTKVAGLVTLDATATLALTNRENGNTYKFGAAMPLMQTETDQVTLKGGIGFGDRKHMQTYYGVTQQQTVASGYRYRNYTAKAGVEDISLAVNWNHVLDKNWMINTTVGVTRQVGNAADTPLALRKTAPMLMTSVNYKF